MAMHGPRVHKVLVIVLSRACSVAALESQESSRRDTNLSARSAGHASRSLGGRSPFLLPPLSSRSGGYLWLLWSGGAMVMCCQLHHTTAQLIEGLAVYITAQAAELCPRRLHSRAL